VGADAYKFLAREHILLNSLTELIKGARVEELPERIQGLLEKIKEIEKELTTLRSAQALAGVDQLATSAVTIGELSFIGGVLADGVSGDDLRKIATELRSRGSNTVVALISSTGGRPVLVAATSDGARSLGVKAGELVKIGSTVLGGGGGGKDDFAQGGGTDLSATLAALSAIEKSLLGQ
jgi:alanyl-tRNA synthetase